MRDDAREWAGSRLYAEPIVKLALEYAGVKGTTYNAARQRLEKALKEEQVAGRAKGRVYAPPGRPAAFALPQNKALFDWVTSRARRDEISAEIAAFLPAKCLILADLHIPFTDWDAVWACVEAHRDATFVVINGDLFDCHNISSFLVSPKETVVAEVERGRAFLADLNRLFGRAYYTLGNHEMRFGRRLREAAQADPRAGEAIAFLLEALHCPSGDLTELVTQVDGTRGAYGYMVRAGDAIIGHPRCFSAITLRTGAWLSDHLAVWEKEYSAEGFSTVVCSHTHHVGNAIIRGKQVIEAGCLCHAEDYLLTGKIMAANRQERWHKGCAYLSLRADGSVEHNKSGYWLA